MSIEWTETAAADLESIGSYIGQDDAPAAQRAVQEIVASVQRLDAFPGMGRPGRVVGTRELIPRNLPYVVVYEAGSGRVLVLRILHTAQAWPPRP